MCKCNANCPLELTFKNGAEGFDLREQKHIWYSFPQMWPAKKTAWNGPTPTMVQCNFQCVCVRQSYFRIVLGLFQSNSPQMFLICQTHIISNYWKHLFWLPRAVLCGILCNRSCGCSRRIGSKSLLKASKKKKKPRSQTFLSEEEKEELTELFPISSHWKERESETLEMKGWRRLDGNRWGDLVGWVRHRKRFIIFNMMTVKPRPICEYL